MTPEDWFELLRRHLGATVDPPSATEIDALLDLARVAAHTSERWTAPVSGFLAGMAHAHLDGETREAGLRALADGLEADGATSS